MSTKHIIYSNLNRSCSDYLPLIFYLIISFLFFKSSSSQQNWAQRTEFPCARLSIHAHSPSHATNIPHQSGTLVTTDEPTMAHHFLIQNPQFTLGFIPAGVLSMNCDKWISIHHCGCVVENSFITLKILCALPILEH